MRGYDPNGNLTCILGNDAAGNALAVSCTCDSRNRMVEYRDITTGQRHTYAYDTFSRRVAKTVDADGASPTTSLYSYGGETRWQVCAAYGRRALCVSPARDGLPVHVIVR